MKLIRKGKQNVGGLRHGWEKDGRKKNKRMNRKWEKIKKKRVAMKCTRILKLKQSCRYKLHAAFNEYNPYKHIHTGHTELHYLVDHSKCSVRRTVNCIVIYSFRSRAQQFIQKRLKWTLADRPASSLWLIVFDVSCNCKKKNEREKSICTLQQQQKNARATESDYIMFTLSLCQCQ